MMNTFARTCLLLLALGACNEGQDAPIVEPPTPALIRVRATYAGEAPTFVQASCDDGACGTAALDGSGSTVFRTGEGTRAVALTVPSNCAVDLPNPITVTAVGGSTIDADFTIRCTGPGTARITIQAEGNGTSPLFFYQVEYGDPNCNLVDACGYVQVQAGSTGVVTVPAGLVSFGLIGVPFGCRVTTAAPVLVDVLPGATVDVRFDLQCD